MVRRLVDTNESSSDSSSDEFETEVLAVCTSAVNFMANFVHRSVNQHRPNQTRQVIMRDRGEANNRLMRDYFIENPRWPQPRVFKQRFRMSKQLFLHLREDLEREVGYFKQKSDALGKLGFTTTQKLTAAIRILAFAQTSDINDEYLHMAAKTIRDTLREFAIAICEIYGRRYLRKPTWFDLQKIYDVHADMHDLPGMIDSIDCRHWQWERCPTAWRGQHTRGNQKGPTKILQAVCSQDLWCWHAFFGAAGSNNDLNVLQQSPLIEDIVSGKMSTASFYANNNYYPYGYFLGDGIYPEHSYIVKTFTDTVDEKRLHFKKQQESARKDIERFFGVLKQRWAYIRTPCKLWSTETMEYITEACIILHNMILEDEENAYCQDYRPEAVEEDENREQAPMPVRLQNTRYMRSGNVHNSLKADLVEHVWARKQHRVRNGEVEDEEITDEEFEDLGDEPVVDLGDDEEDYYASDDYDDADYASDE